MTHPFFDRLRRHIAIRRASLWALGAAAFLWILCAGSPAGAAAPYHRITVVDDQTSRGVPWVRLRLPNAEEFWTDSAGVVAFREPSLMDKWVYFLVESYGYSIAPDAQGNRGVRIFAATGGASVVRLHRENVAERLYRQTGTGIYGNSVELGDAVPPTCDAATDPVMGQDGGISVLFKNTIYWMWGDTGVARYPLGNFKSTGAISQPPSQGGLDPEVGVALTYFRQSNGSVKAMANIPFNGLIWLGAMYVVPDQSDREHFLAEYMKVQGYLNVVERGLSEFNESTQVFDFLTSFSVDSVVFPSGLALFQQRGGVDYINTCDPWPTVRVRATYEAVQDLANYEAFTCLKAGSRIDYTSEQLDRDPSGTLLWGWKPDTSPIRENEMRQLLNRGLIQKDEAWYRVTDVNTGAEVLPHNGSVAFNPYRNRWISIRGQNWGLSWLGEIWYLEADTPAGPWAYAEKILTHYGGPGNTYTYYNPMQHTVFDKEGGRVIFIGGSCSTEWANVDHPTPEYNYNIMMYKLQLDDPRLFLPVPVYAIYDPIRRYFTNDDIPDTETSRTIVCFAPDRARADTVPVYEYVNATTGTVILSTDGSMTPPPAGRIFYGVANSTPIAPGTDLAQTVPLYEYVDPATGRRYYTTTDTGPAGYARSPAPVCRVWPNPVKFNPYKVINP